MHILGSGEYTESLEEERRENQSRFNAADERRVGWINTMSSLQYNHTHRLYRKLAYQQLGSKAAVSKYYHLQEKAVSRFLWRANRDKGKNLEKHLKT